MEAGVSQKLPDCVKRTQRLAHNQYNQRKKDLLYTSPKTSTPSCSKSLCYVRQGWDGGALWWRYLEGGEECQGVGGKDGTLTISLSIASHPKPCSYSVQSKILVYIPKSEKKKIKEEEVTKWQYPSSLKTVQVLPTTFLHMLLASCQSPWSRWCQGRWKPCLQLPLRKCVTTWEEQKEIWAQPSLFATVYLWGSSSLQAQPEREIPVLQLVRYSRLVTKPHTIQMPSKVAGAGKHSIHWSYHIP